MSKVKNVASTEATENVNSNNEVVAVAEQPKTVAAVPVIKTTPVEERLYKPVDEKAAYVFKGKQKQIVYNILLTQAEPMSISQVAAIAEEKGLKAIGGVEPSVRYHLHHLTKEGLTTVTNPTITIE